jgi:hypothetical protein
MSNFQMTKQLIGHLVIEHWSFIGGMNTEEANYLLA